MPNWCECKLRLKGSKQDLLNCIYFVKEEDNIFSVNKILPYPKEYADADANSGLLCDGFNNGGKDWCLDNWGCKWPPCDVTFHKNCYYFSTPWSPPEQLIQHLSKLFPLIKFTLWFWEAGCCFKGKYIFLNGIKTDSLVTKYHGPKGG